VIKFRFDPNKKGDARMGIKITEKARELYGALCPISTGKCESVEELDYKINRAVDFGKVLKIKNGVSYVLYYNNLFHIKNNEIIHLEKSNARYFVDEKKKSKHYNNTYKVLV
jgi:hypothetical protein